MIAYGTRPEASLRRIRHLFRVPAFLGSSVTFQGRPATIVGGFGEHKLYIRLEDRIDKTVIRCRVEEVTFLEKYRRNTKVKVESSIDKKHDAFEEGWW